MSARTHPFVKFDFDVSTIDSYTWMLLGEAMSKCQRFAGFAAASHHRPTRWLASTWLAACKPQPRSRATPFLPTRFSRSSSTTADLPEYRDYQQLEVQNILGAIKEIDQALQRGQNSPYRPGPSLLPEP